MLAITPFESNGGDIMNKQLNQAVCALAMIMAVSSVGCSSGFKSGGASMNDSQSAAAQNGEDQVAKSEAAVVEGQKAMESATLALAGLSTSNGTIDLSLFEGTGQGGVLAPLIAKLKPVFDDAFAKVQAVKVQFDASKAALAVEIAKLDPNDPTAVLLTEQLAKITDMEAKFSDQVHALAAKLTGVNTQIDTLVAQATAYIPIPGLSIIAGFFIDTFIVNDVKNLILDLQTRLMAL
jgi:hypothetical protein